MTGKFKLRAKTNQEETKRTIQDSPLPGSGSLKNQPDK